MRKIGIAIITVMLLVITGCAENESGTENKKTNFDVEAEPLVINNDNNESDKDDFIDDNTYKESIESLVSEVCNHEEISVYLKNINENKSGSLNSHKMQAASLIKLYISGSVYENYEGVCTYIGSEEKVENLIKKMITISDNDAANTLTTALGEGDAYLGRKCVDNFCIKHEYKDTHMGRLLLQSNTEDDNYTSVDDCGHFLFDIYNKKLEGSEKIYNFMKQQERREKIPAGIPENIVVANKTGELSDVENDVAIVESDKKTYILCIMAENISDTYTLRKNEAEISKRVFLDIVGE